MESTQAVLALEALAQQSRLAIFRLLVGAGPKGLSVGEIAAAVGLPGATLSFHLSQLRNAGLISYERNGRSLVYSADFSVMNGLVGFLTDHCCGGNASQCAPVAAPVRPVARAAGRKKSAKRKTV